MTKQIFVNLPVKDLKKSVDFFTKLGFKFNLEFTDETGTCMVISDTIYCMLLNEKKFSGFSKKPVTDTKKSGEVLIAISMDNRKQVDEIVKKAVAAGGSTYNPPQDYGWMYGHGFADLDGHQWEVFYMDEKARQKAMKVVKK